MSSDLATDAPAARNFGRSTRFDALTAPSATRPIGTPHYAAPELARAWLAFDLPGVERQSFAAAPLDCWALGIVCYQLLVADGCWWLLLVASDCFDCC